MNNFFDDDGYLCDWLNEKGFDDEAELEGDEASAFLASVFAGATHGNYEAETLFRRQKYTLDQYFISLKKIK